MVPLLCHASALVSTRIPTRHAVAPLPQHQWRLHHPQVRYDRVVGASTSLKFVTDGILLRELQDDFLLRRYSAVVVDEAHERSLNTDLLLGGWLGGGLGGGLDDWEEGAGLGWDGRGAGWAWLGACSGQQRCAEVGGATSGGPGVGHRCEATSRCLTAAWFPCCVKV